MNDFDELFTMPLLDVLVSVCLTYLSYPAAVGDTPDDNPQTDWSFGYFR